MGDSPAIGSPTSLDIRELLNTPRDTSSELTAELDSNHEDENEQHQKYLIHLHNSFNIPVYLRSQHSFEALVTRSRADLDAAHI